MDGRDDADLTWRDHSACRGVDPDVFFPEISFTGKASDREFTDPAFWHCNQCPPDVFIQCHTWALAHENEGIWAKTTPPQRRRLRKALGMTVQPIIIDLTWLLNPAPPTDDLDQPDDVYDEPELGLDELDYDEDLQP